MSLLHGHGHVSDVSLIEKGRAVEVKNEDGVAEEKAVGAES